MTPTFTKPLLESKATEYNESFDFETILFGDHYVGVLWNFRSSKIEIILCKL